MTKKFHLNKNNRYLLRQVNINDALDIYNIAKSPDVSIYLNWEYHKDINETISVINNIYLGRKDYPNSYVIVDVNKDKVIGIIDFVPGQIADNNYPNIGFFLHKNYWNQGIMSMALNKMLDIGFNLYNYDIIGISHMINNIGSMNVIVKNKFKYIKTVNNVKMGKHDNATIKYYEISRSEFNAYKQS